LAFSGGDIDIPPSPAISFSIHPVGQVPDIAQLWRDLEMRADVTFYLTWGWIGHWLAEIDADCYVVIGRLEERVVALALLTRAKHQRHGLLNLNVLLLNEVGDPDVDVITIEYNGILTDRSVTEAATVGCLQFLQRPEVTATIGQQWHEIHFGGVPHWFEKYTNDTGLWIWHQSKKPSWAIDLEKIRASGKPYLEHLSSNTRYQIRRTLRLYEQRGVVTATPARDAAEAMKFYGEMQELHQRYWVAKGEPGSYAFPFYKRFHTQVLTDCIPLGTVELVRVAAGDTVIGYVYNFTSNGWICAYHTGLAYDPDPKLKPGLLSHYLCIEHHLKTGAKRYDFLAGDHRYKANLGSPGPEMMHLVLQRPILSLRTEWALRRVKTAVLSRWPEDVSPGSATAMADETLDLPARVAKNGKVLVLGDDTRSFLTTVRSLGRKGIEVHAAPINLRSPALKSRYVGKVHRLPVYIGNGADWVKSVQGLLASEKFNLVIPCDDRTVLPLNAHRKALSKSATIAIPDPASIDTLFDKEKTRLLAASLGINLARTILPQEGRSPEEIFRILGAPVVIKPKHSYGIETLFRRAVVRTVETPAQLAEVTAELAPDEYYYEAYFPGSGVGMSVLADKGEVLLAFQHHRVHESDRGGASAYRVSAPISAELLDACTKIMGALSYTGLAMFEFRRNFENGRWILLEVNARPWGSMPLPVSLGIDFPAAWYRLLVNHERPAPQTYRTGIYGRNLILDFFHLAGLLSNRRGLPASVREVFSWGRSFWPVLVGRERSDTLVLDDLRPGMAELGEFSGWVANRAGRRLPGALAVQRVLARWRLKKALRAAAAGDRSISLVFVCYGNICRSPFAELSLVRSFASGNRRVRVTSVGTLPLEGRASPSEAVIAARRLGVEMGSHSSRRVRDRVIEEATVVFVFDEANGEAIRARFPELKVPIIKLGLLAGSPATTWEIVDPFGSDDNGYARVFATIEEGVHEIRNSLVEAL
jgi:protein-tyrosine-phosphatase/predicted ATP-grasp superfamily ATP-dependent carboligase/CelD/BcsL family acetyltransferase involved in cellulose biosynthesis